MTQVSDTDSFRNQVVREGSVVEDLQRLIPRLDAMGYSELRIGEALSTQPFTFRRMVHLPVYQARLREFGTLGSAISFFLLQQPLALEELRACIGDYAISALHRMNWLSLGGSGVRCRVQLYPCNGLYFWTDQSAPLEPWSQQVYWLGEDSYTLAYCTPRLPNGRSLDLCTGSGVHAILAARHCGTSLGTDINPRALDFGRLNAQFNGLSVEFRGSDCYASVDGRFDLITLNPPFAPAPAGTSELYRAGGLTGEAVTEAVVRGLPDYLNERGIFAMGTEAPRVRHGSPLRRMADWLGPGWGVAALYKHEFSIEDYVQSHVLASLDYSQTKAEADYQRWLDVYLEMGITSMVAAQFFAWRGADFFAERQLATPLVDHADLTADWLAGLASRGPALSLHPGVRQLYYNQEGVVVEFSDKRWRPELLRLGAEAARVLNALSQGPVEAEESLLAELTRERVIRRVHNF
ncbi:MAG: class I SAM-dependent methyltransferase [Vulcanimicrobiota bacterium]